MKTQEEIKDYLNNKMKHLLVKFETHKTNMFAVYATSTDGAIIGTGGYSRIRKLINHNLKKIFLGIKDHEIIYNHERYVFWIHDSYWTRTNKTNIFSSTI